MASSGETAPVELSLKTCDSEAFRLAQLSHAMVLLLASTAQLLPDSVSDFPSGHSHDLDIENKQLSKHDHDIIPGTRTQNELYPSQTSHTKIATTRYLDDFFEVQATLRLRTEQLSSFSRTAIDKRSYRLPTPSCPCAPSVSDFTALSYPLPAAAAATIPPVRPPCGETAPTCEAPCLYGILDRFQTTSRMDGTNKH